MTINRVTVGAAFGLVLAVSFFALNSDAQPGTLRQIVPGVWFREGDIKQFGHCNNVIIEMKDYLIVVDANFPSGARLALADAKKVSQKPVKYVFDTHHHGDHLYGNPVWTQAGATTLAYKGVTEELKRYEPQGWQTTAKTRKDVAELNLDTAEPPKQTFDKSPFVLNDGKRKVEFHFFGWAHTRGDGFVYLPKEKVICTGDALVNGPYNFTGQGNIGNWSNVLRAAQKLKADFVLPGHGAPGGKELFDGQILFFTELQKGVKSAIDSGKKADDLVAAVKLPESVHNWTGDTLPAQLKDTFEEMTQGKPHGEILGGK
ncbi:MAG: MBL fold metallo-hydrolase [Bryobacteraceae bacterium]